MGKAALTLTADDKSKVYGDANPVLTGSISGIKNGDAITATYSTSATVATGVGSYAVLPTAVDAIPARLGDLRRDPGQCVPVGHEGAVDDHRGGQVEDLR